MPIDSDRAVAAGTTVWWLNSVLAQRCAPDDASGALQGWVTGLDPESAAAGPVPATALIGALRARRVEALSLTFVEPGDPLGVPGPAEVTRAAVAAGLAAVALDGSLTLVPAPGAPPLAWRAWPSTPAREPGAALGSLGEARALMREAMAQVTRAASAEPDAVAMEQLQRYRRFAIPAPPPGIPAAAAQVADAALRVWWLTAMAADLAERCGRPAPADLARLRPLARRAAAVAFSVRPGPSS